MSYKTGVKMHTLHVCFCSGKTFLNVSIASKPFSAIQILKCKSFEHENPFKLDILKTQQLDCFNSE